MLKISSFRGIRPSPQYVKEIVSLPYDVISRQEAYTLAQGKPFSFLRVIRSDLEFPNDSDTYQQKIYERANENLKSFIKKGVLVQEADNSYYIYVVKSKNRSQIGLVALFSAKDYNDGLIKKHELTTSEKEKDRSNHIKTLRAHTGLSFLIYRAQEAKKLSTMLEAYISNNTPLYVLPFPEEESEHSLYCMNKNEDMKKLEEGFNSIKSLYIADGHHRTASAAKVASELKQNKNSNTKPDYFLAAAFPDAQTQILPYYRVIRNLNGLSKKEFLDKLESNEFRLKNGKQENLNSQQANMCLEGQWYHLEWDLAVEATVPETLTVHVLQEKIFNPILGITNPKKSDNISFVGGIHSETHLEKLVSSLGYSCFYC